MEGASIARTDEGSHSSSFSRSFNYCFISDSGSFHAASVEIYLQARHSFEIQNVNAAICLDMECNWKSKYMVVAQSRSLYVFHDLPVYLRQSLPASASSLPLPMRAAIYDSILSLGDMDSTLNIDCPTGNCAFEEIETLGFCSICNDVTAEITVNCTEGKAFDGVDEDKYCSYFLPGNLTIPVQRGIVDGDFRRPFDSSDQIIETTDMNVVVLPRFQSLWPRDFMPGQPDREPNTTTFQGISNPLLAFGRVVFNKSDVPAPTIGGKVNPRATECALSWCVQRLATGVRNGIISQNTTTTWLNTSTLDTADVYLTPAAGQNLSTGKDPRTYYVSAMRNLPLVKFLETTFTTNASFINLPGSDLGPNKSSALTVYSSDVAQALYIIEDLSGFMNNLADRMTDTLRNHYQDPALDIQGKVYVMETYISVRWPWLILPITLLFASCGLLVASILSTHGHRSTLWKNDSLATLFHGLEASERTNNVVFKREMKSLAEKTTVQLREDTQGVMRLVDEQRPPDTPVSKESKPPRLEMLFGHERRNS